MLRRQTNILTALFAILCVGLACSKKTPSRDHIPELRNKLFQLQQAVADRNRAAVDSLLSLQILDHEQDSDSLLRFIYGASYDYPFSQLGNYEIFYTEEKARIDCDIMDTAGSSGRTVTFTLVREHDMWLFKRFEPKLPDLTTVAE